MSLQTSKIRVGVVGVGYLGQFHAEKYVHMEGVELVGVVDHDRSQADGVANKLGVPAFYRIDDLLGKVDAISVVTPTPFHFEVSKAFLEHNTHLFIEKPISTNLDEADALIEMAAAAGKVIQVGHIERFNPAFRALPSRELEPRFIEAHRISVYKDRALDVSVIIDLMIHDLDLVLSLVKQPVSEMMVQGAAVITPHIDIANARLVFEGGCIANITASRIALESTRKFHVFDEKGYYSVDFATRQLVSAHQDSSVVDGPIPGMAVLQEIVDQADALEAELKSFIDAIRTGSPPLVSGADGRKALALAHAIETEIMATIAPSENSSFGASA